MQKKLKGGKKKTDIFEKIADEMQSLGIDCTGSQCWKKINRMIRSRNKV